MKRVFATMKHILILLLALTLVGCNAAKQAGDTLPPPTPKGTALAGNWKVSATTSGGQTSVFTASVRIDANIGTQSQPDTATTCEHDGSGVLAGDFFYVGLNLLPNPIICADSDLNGTSTITAVSGPFLAPPVLLFVAAPCLAPLCYNPGETGYVNNMTERMADGSPVEGIFVESDGFWTYTFALHGTVTGGVITGPWYDDNDGTSGTFTATKQ
jgi:hypothetical protein